MSEYRVTRPDCYKGNCPGRSDLSARQGHYCDASSPEEAKEIVRKRLGLSADEPLDVQIWGLS
jgi:hypothetical protein